MFEELDEAGLVARIASLETAKSAAAAEQARAAVVLAELRCAREAAAGIPKAKWGRGVGSEVALARRESPNQGGRHLGFAQALVYEMPHTLAALECGVLSEWRATLIVRESACLTVADRRTLDVEMCADPSTLEGKGNKRIEADAKAIAYRLDAKAVVDRAVRAESECSVSVRPAPDTMAYVTALMPMAAAVGVYAALRRQADTTFDGRSRGKVMTDTMSERITGRPADVPEPIAVNLVITDEALFASGDDPAVVSGHGPIPAAIGRRLVLDALADDRSKATLRRLYRHPKSAGLVALESRSRCFPKSLATFIALRDQSCRTPYCDARIRHHDHAHPHHKGGETSARNGAGSCERCNYVKETPGWNVATDDADGIHTAEYITPTGARYRSSAPRLPGPPYVEIGEVERRLRVVVGDYRAA